MEASTANRKSAPEVFELRPDALPEVARERMENGVELVTLDMGTQPVGRIAVVWPVGSADVENAAAVRLLRAMATEGTVNHSGSELAEAFEYNGAWIRVEIARHMTSVTAWFLNKTAAEILPLVAEVVSQPVYCREAFERIREKEASACEIARRKVIVRAGEIIDRLMFGAGNPLSVTVSPDDIKLVECDTLHRIQRELMAETRPRVYLAGLLTSDVLEHVRSTFGRIPFGANGGGLERRIVQAGFNPEGKTEVCRMEQSMQTAIKMALPAIGREHPDYETLRYTVFALGGYFGSRLMKNIREDKGYTYGITAGVASLPEGAFVNVTCQTDNRYASKVLEEIEKEIAGMCECPPDDTEMEVVRSTAMTGLTAILDSPFSIMDYHQMTDLFNLPAGYYARQVSALVSLTGEGAAECARRYLAAAPRLIAMAGNPE